MRLYYAPGTISIAVAIALEEAGLTYEPVRVDFAAAEQTKPAYQAINPKGRVPALDVNGVILTETGAILDWIAATAPAAGLLPDDLLEAARARALMYYLASTMHVNHAHKMRGARWASEDASFADMRAKVPETMAASARYVEDHCLVGPYVLGDQLCMADPYLFVVCNWLKGDGVAIANFPKIARFMEAMGGRPSVQAVRRKGLMQ